MDLILAFETSCDDTCAAVVDGNLNVLSNVVSSQIEIHKLYGGVVPEIASRNHAMAIQTVYEEALSRAGVTLDDITQIAATTHPGLRGAVMVGQVFAESLATAAGKPFVAVNHLAGHIASVILPTQITNYKLHSEATQGSREAGFLQITNVGKRESKVGGQSHLSPVKPPFLSLLVSGGHTCLYKVKTWQDIELLCETSDDAVGEAFDKVAKLLVLGYPGGPAISKNAELFTHPVTPAACHPSNLEGNTYVKFVHQPSKKDGFSYSGLKTAVLNYVNRARVIASAPVAERPAKQSHGNIDIPHICASFQHEAVMQLVDKCIEYLKRFKMKTLCVCGGVAANKYLRERMTEACAAIGAKVYFPEMQYCTDNAAMIGAAVVLRTTMNNEE